MWEEPGKIPCQNHTLDQADVNPARYLSATEKHGLLRYIRELDLNLCFGNPEDILQLKQLRALESVHKFTIRFLVLHKVLPTFDRCFSQFVPTLRSLSLKQLRCENGHRLMEFVCQFPHLDDFTLTHVIRRASTGLPSLLHGQKGHNRNNLYRLGAAWFSMDSVPSSNPCWIFRVVSALIQSRLVVV